MSTVWEKNLLTDVPELMHFAELNYADIEKRILSILHIQRPHQYKPEGVDHMNPNQICPPKSIKESEIYEKAFRTARNYGANGSNATASAMAALQAYREAQWIVQPFPSAPVPQPSRAEFVELTKKQIAEQAKADAKRLEEAEAALAAEEAHKARIASIDHDHALSRATGLLMEYVRNLVNGNTTAGNSVELAKFRKELQPLAEKHGYRIVLVGNKKQASVVEI